MKKLNVSLEKVERVSTKTNNPYEVTLITLTCPKCGVYVVIEDFNVKIPFNVDSVLCSVNKVDNRFVIEELNYSIPWQYSLGVGLLINHTCK